VKFEGDRPEYDENDFVPCPVKKGSVAPVVTYFT
jgi:hypothetical protein